MYWWWTCMCDAANCFVDYSNRSWKSVCFHATFHSKQKSSQVLEKTKIYVFNLKRSSLLLWLCNGSWSEKEIDFSRKTKWNGAAAAVFVAAAPFIDYVGVPRGLPVPPPCAWAGHIPHPRPLLRLNSCRASVAAKTRTIFIDKGAYLTETYMSIFNVRWQLLFGATYLKFSRRHLVTLLVDNKLLHWPWPDMAISWTCCDPSHSNSQNKDV